MALSMNRREGFSLLEVLVALAIVSLTLFLTFTINANSISIEQVIQQRLAAVSEGEMILNEEISSFPDKGTRTGEVREGEFQYTYSIQVTETPHPDALEVNVTLFWDLEGSRKSLTLTGLAIR